MRVLVLTFNRTLRGYINELAKEQVDATDEITLTVETFGGWALSILGKQAFLHDDGRPLIRSLVSSAGISRENQDYFVDEVRYILGRFRPDQRDKYLDAVRSGRGRAPAVPRSLRSRLLAEVIAPYELKKSQTGRVDWNDLALRVAEVPCQNYDIAVVDESQDLSANQIRAILAHLDENHATTFITDAVQRIYPQGFQWREIGINMGPAIVSSLSRNYRNTAEIARLASSLVENLPLDRDGMIPDEQSCQESGVSPQVVEGKYSSQINYMLDRVQPFLNSGDTVAILHPWGWFNYVRSVLQQRNIQYCELTRNREWPRGPELLALSTIHSAKGLEFEHVLLPGLSDRVTPHGDEDGDGTLESLRRLVAMGVGRARKSVMLGFKPGERSSVFDFIDSETYDLVEV